MIYLRSALSFAGDLIRAVLTIPINKAGRLIEDAIWDHDDCCEVESPPDDTWDEFTANRFREAMTDERMRRFIEGESA